MRCPPPLAPFGPVEPHRGCPDPHTPVGWELLWDAHTPPLQCLVTHRKVAGHKNTWNTRSMRRNSHSHLLLSYTPSTTLIKECRQTLKNSQPEPRNSHLKTSGPVYKLGVLDLLGSVPEMCVIKSSHSARVFASICSPQKPVAPGTSWSSSAFLTGILPWHLYGQYWVSMPCFGYALLWACWRARVQKG